MANIKKTLEELGLSDKEAKVYLALLELGPSPVQAIGKKADVNRVTTYVNLESLSVLGLVSTIEKGKKTYYTAEPPEQLESLLLRQQKEIETKKEELSKALPDLKRLFEYAGDRPIVRFYEGVDGIKAMQEDFFRGNTENKVFTFISLDDLFKTFPSYEKDYSSRRVSKKIKANIIYTYSGGKYPKSYSADDLREARWVPAEQFPFGCGVNISGKRVFITSYKNPVVGVAIENENIAATLKAIFKLAWEAAEKYNK